VAPVSSATEPGPATPAAPAEGKKVSWAELFFDLVFVFAVTEVSARLQADHRGLGLLRALVVFVPVYWTWAGTTLQANVRDVARPAVRLAIFAVALCGLFIALAIPYAFEGRAVLFASAYWIGRVVLGVPVLVQVRSPNPYLVSMTVTGPLLMAGALLPGGVRLAVWAAAAVLDLSAPTLLRRRLRGNRYDAGHLAERFGLLVLIALGESVVAIGAAAQHEARIGVGAGLAVAAAFALSCGLWWVYFHFAADAVRYALATAAVQLDITRHVLSYGHLSFIAAIIGVAVGTQDAVAAPTSGLGWAGAGFLYGGTALYLATFGYTRWKMFRLVSATRLGASAVVLALMPAAAQVPSVAALAGLALVVGGLNLIEWARVARIGWRAALARRAERAAPAG
jgi:low temperature requirement protein LtrA